MDGYLDNSLLCPDCGNTIFTLVTEEGVTIETRHVCGDLQRRMDRFIEEHGVPENISFYFDINEL
jgi:hypothetical protein